MWEFSFLMWFLAVIVCWLFIMGCDERRYVKRDDNLDDLEFNFDQYRDRW